MSLMEKLKKIFNRNKELSIESEDVPILDSECKYEKMTLFAPTKVFYEGNKNNFYINALDKDNKPIPNETIKVQYNGEECELKTDEEGTVKWHVDLPPNKYELKIQYPNGDYSQVIESRIKCQRV